MGRLTRRLVLTGDMEWKSLEGCFLCFDPFMVSKDHGLDGLLRCSKG